jgi:hypothetical protein
VNNKYLVQLIAFILLGFVAVADPGKKELSHLHPGKYLVDDTGATVNDHAVAHNNRPVFRCNLPAKRASTIRSRFRAVSLIQLSAADATQLVGSIISSYITNLASGINTAHLPPFYYIFLFRLTPF